MVPPFMNAYGQVTKILEKMIQAQQPERFTLDFLNTKLGFDSGSARPIIPLLKRLGFISSDGSPTKLYSRFRNPEERGAAMAEAMRVAYREVFERNEFAHDLVKDKLKNLIVEITGLSPGDATVGAVVNTFNNLKSFANFDASGAVESKSSAKALVIEQPNEAPRPSSEMGFNLSYTINLNLPETADVEVFNAIFKSLKEHLLNR